LHGNRRARAQPKKAPHGATASASNFNTAVSVRSAHVSMSQGPSRIRRLGRSHAERDSARADERPRLVLSQPPPQPNQAVGLRPNRADHPRRRITPASVAIDRRWGSRSDERGAALGLILRLHGPGLLKNHGQTGRLHTARSLQPMATPKIRPIAAVTAMARTPPMVTRSAARPSEAPPR
jgi:hypothetical protein